VRPPSIFDGIIMPLDIFGDKMVNAHTVNDDLLRSLAVHRLVPVPAIYLVRDVDSISNHGMLEIHVVLLAVGFVNVILHSQDV
jgi:hypothetical protein